MSFKKTKYSCSKHFDDFPCCHRQWKHSGHCHFAHGYSRSFTFWFEATELDENGFVVDFSSLNQLEKRLKSHFDHTFLVNKDDPLLSKWRELHELKALDLRIMENVGMEFTAELIWEWANLILLERDSKRACCFKTESRENEKNAATFENTPKWFLN